MPLLCIGNGGSGDAHYNEVATERPDDSISAGHTRLLRIASAFGAPTTVTTFVLALLRDPTPSAQLSRLTNSACIDLPRNHYAITIANLWGAQDPRSVGSRLVQALPHRPGCFFLGPSDTSRDCRKTNYSLALSFYLCSARKEMRRRGGGVIGCLTYRRTIRSLTIRSSTTDRRRSPIHDFLYTDKLAIQSSPFVYIARTAFSLSSLAEAGDRLRPSDPSLLHLQFST